MDVALGQEALLVLGAGLLLGGLQPAAPCRHNQVQHKHASVSAGASACSCTGESVQRGGRGVAVRVTARSAQGWEVRQGGADGGGQGAGRTVAAASPAGLLPACCQPACSPTPATALPDPARRHTCTNTLSLSPTQHALALVAPPTPARCPAPPSTTTSTPSHPLPPTHPGSPLPPCRGRWRWLRWGPPPCRPAPAPCAQHAQRSTAGGGGQAAWGRGGSGMRGRGSGGGVGEKAEARGTRQAEAGRGGQRQRLVSTKAPPHTHTPTTTPPHPTHPTHPHPHPHPKHTRTQAARRPGETHTTTHTPPPTPPRTSSMYCFCSSVSSTTSACFSAQGCRDRRLKGWLGSKGCGQQWGGRVRMLFFATAHPPHPNAEARGREGHPAGRLLLHMPARVPPAPPPPSCRSSAAWLRRRRRPRQAGMTLRPLPPGLCGAACDQCRWGRRRSPCCTAGQGERVQRAGWVQVRDTGPEQAERCQRPCSPSLPPALPPRPQPHDRNEPGHCSNEPQLPPPPLLSHPPPPTSGTCCTVRQSCSCSGWRPPRGQIGGCAGLGGGSAGRAGRCQEVPAAGRQQLTSAAMHDHAAGCARAWRRGASSCRQHVQAPTQPEQQGLKHPCCQQASGGPPTHSPRALPTRRTPTCGEVLLVVVQRPHHRCMHLLHRKIVHDFARRRSCSRGEGALAGGVLVGRRHAPLQQLRQWWGIRRHSQWHIQVKQQDYFA